MQLAVHRLCYHFPSLNLLTTLFLMEARTPLANFATRAHHWLIFNLGDPQDLFSKGKLGSCWNGVCGCGSRKISLWSDTYSLVLTLEVSEENFSLSALQNIFLCINLCLMGNVILNAVLFYMNVQHHS